MVKHEILEDGGMINVGRYKQFLDNCFNHLQGVGIATERIHWMHDNVEEHLNEMVVTKVCQPPYLPDVNLLDRYVSRYMENSRRSHDFDEIFAVRQLLQGFLQNLTR